MPRKRTRPHSPPASHSGSKTTSASSLPSKKPKKSSPDASTGKDLTGVKIYVLQAKLSGAEINDLNALAEGAGAIICSTPDDADVLVTNMRMKKRLERHVSWRVAREKAIVTPEWLRKSVQLGKLAACGDYAALSDLREETVHNCPDNDNYSGCAECHSLSPPIIMKEKERKRSHLSSSLPPASSPDPGVSLLPTALPTDLTKLDYTARYACARASPLVCPNQALVRELAIIRRSRELEGEQRSSLSYQRAIATLKAYPMLLTSTQQVTNLPFIGPKITSMIEQFIDTGHITAAREIASSTRFASLSTFADIYGIGPVTARKLYSTGLRTIDDLRLYYGVNENEDDDLGEDGGESIGIKVGLALYNDLRIKIPRNEVEEMNRLVYAELCAIQPGCAYTIVGGYRRGKPESNDVDIVFTHPEPGKEKGLCERLVKRLKEKGMVTHVMRKHFIFPSSICTDTHSHLLLSIDLSSFHKPTSALPKSQNTHWDTLEKALTVFRLPPSSPLCTDHVKQGGRSRTIARRLDLIFAPVEVYWCAVIGWTGSMMFERDIRQWTKDKKGWRFDSSGIVRLADSSLVLAKSELEVFQMCGLEWVDPTMRNADA